MITLLKTELSYLLYKVHIPIVSVILLIFYSVLAEFNPTNLTCFIVLAQLFSFIFIGMSKDNREYKINTLNISYRKIAMFRILIVLIIFMVIYSLGLLAHWIIDIPQSGFRDSKLELIMFGGIGLMAIFTQ